MAADRGGGPGARRRAVLRRDRAAAVRLRLRPRPVCRSGGVARPRQRLHVQRTLQRQVSTGLPAASRAREPAVARPLCGDGRGDRARGRARARTGVPVCPGARPNARPAADDCPGPLGFLLQRDVRCGGVRPRVSRHHRGLPVLGGTSVCIRGFTICRPRDDRRAAARIRGAGPHGRCGARRRVRADARAPGAGRRQTAAARRPCRPRGGGRRGGGLDGDPGGAPPATVCGAVLRFLRSATPGRRPPHRRQRHADGGWRSATGRGARAAAPRRSRGAAHEPGMGETALVLARRRRRGRARGHRRVPRLAPIATARRLVFPVLHGDHPALAVRRDAIPGGCGIPLLPVCGRWSGGGPGAGTRASGVDRPGDGGVRAHAGGRWMRHVGASPGGLVAAGYGRSPRLRRTAGHRPVDPGRRLAARRGAGLPHRRTRVRGRIRGSRRGADLRVRAPQRCREPAALDGGSGAGRRLDSQPFAARRAGDVDMGRVTAFRHRPVDGSAPAVHEWRRDARRAGRAVAGLRGGVRLHHPWRPVLSPRRRGAIRHPSRRRSRPLRRRRRLPGRPRLRRSIPRGQRPIGGLHRFAHLFGEFVHHALETRLALARAGAVRVPRRQRHTAERQEGGPDH